MRYVLVIFILIVLSGSERYRARHATLSDAACVEQSAVVSSLLVSPLKDSRADWELERALGTVVANTRPSGLYGHTLQASVSPSPTASISVTPSNPLPCSASARVVNTTVTTGSFGGVAGADILCSSVLPGCWKAFLVDETGCSGAPCRRASLTPSAGDAQIDWVLRANTNYCRAHDLAYLFSTNAAGLITFPTYQSINPGGSNIGCWWGGTTDWTTVTGSTCNSWTSTSAGVFGELMGMGTTVNGAAPGSMIDSGIGACGNPSYHLLCIEQLTCSSTPTATVTRTPSVTPTPSKSSSVSPTSSVTPSKSATPSSSPSQTVTPTQSPSVTPTSTVTPSSTATPTGTLSSSPVSASPTPAPSVSPTNACVPVCAHGTCGAGGVCACVPGFTGGACDITLVPSLGPCASGCTQPLTGGSTVTVPASGVVPGIILVVGGVSVAYTVTGSPATLQFVAPPQPAGYANVTAFYAGTGLSAATFVFYAVDCSGEGVVLLNGVCEPCPEGAFCPGGDRMWPLPGYWSPDERTPPRACFLAFSCPGAVAVAVPSSTGGRATDLCAAGYTGAYCSQCAEGYYRDDGRCRSCKESADAAKQSTVDLTILYITGAVAIFLLMLGVAFFPSRRLNAWISTLLIIQQLIYVGRNAAKFIPGPTGERLADAFRSMSILLLDIEFIRPACALPDITFVGIFWGTLLAVLITMVLLLGSSALYGFWSRRREKGKAFSFYFRTRATYAAIILGFIMYLQMCIRIFQAINCRRDGAGVLRLEVELVTVCYEAAHLPVGVVAWILLVVFAVGFPTVVLVGLIRAVREHHLEEFANEQFGYVVQGLNLKWFWFRTAAMFNTLLLAAETIFIAAADWRIFASCTTFLFNFTLVGRMWPFQSVRDNVLAMVTGLANIVQIIVYEDKLNSERLFWAAIAILIASLIFVFFMRIGPTRRALASRENLSKVVICGECCAMPVSPSDAASSESLFISSSLSSSSSIASPTAFRIAPPPPLDGKGGLYSLCDDDYGTPIWKRAKKKREKKHFEQRRKRAAAHLSPTTSSTGTTDVDTRLTPRASRSKAAASLPGSQKSTSAAPSSGRQSAAASVDDATTHSPTTPMEN